MTAKCSFCTNRAAGLVSEFRLSFQLCSEHMKKFNRFLQAKRDMQTTHLEDMRVTERLLRDNPGILPCPRCGSDLQVHHWEKFGGRKVPVFRCRFCEFTG